MVINIDGNNLKQGLLGLVIALVEIITEALKHQAVKRMEGGDLTEAEIDRLGEALMDLDSALEQIKQDQGVAESASAVRNGLDDIVDEMLDRFLSPERWIEEPCASAQG
ncbi:MAG: gas vesicle protein K [Dehalococcoidia bacterium]|nr:gas vesicle protein K [Dehalococcoidia bacterium]